MRISKLAALVLLVLGAALVYGARVIAGYQHSQDESEARTLAVKLVGAVIVLCGLTILFAS